MTQEKFEDLFCSKPKLEGHFNKILKPILDYDKGGVVVIHAKFGMGKTFLCNLYKNFLEDKKIKCQIWNAAIYPHATPPFSWINNEIAWIFSKEDKPEGIGLLQKAKSVMSNTDFAYNLNF